MSKRKTKRDLEKEVIELRKEVEQLRTDYDGDLEEEIADFKEVKEERDEYLQELENLKLYNSAPENLKEEIILERFTEFFSRKDYKRLENMLDLYELL